MRGTRRRQMSAVKAAGLIPTYAGNTNSLVRFRPTKRAHPHVCGEHCQDLATAGDVVGSSPRMRGTPYELRKLKLFEGLIPTYAGNTKRPPPAGPWERAHPHVCGEHGDGVSGGAAKKGSSPRMRGTHTLTADDLHGRGLIPTYAGNTRCALTRGRVCRAHPHVCGEHILGRQITTGSGGSSPRMRGTQFGGAA